MLIATKWPLPLDPPGQGSVTAGTRGLCSRSPPRRPACRPVAQKLGSRLRGRFSPSLVPRPPSLMPRAPPFLPLPFPRPGRRGPPERAVSCPSALVSARLTHRASRWFLRQGLAPRAGGPGAGGSGQQCTCRLSPLAPGNGAGPFRGSVWSETVWSIGAVRRSLFLDLSMIE